MKRIISVFILFSLSMIQGTDSEVPNTISYSKTIKTALFACGVYALAQGIKWFNTPNKRMPIIDDLDVITFTPMDSGSPDKITDEKDIDTLFRQKKISGVIKVNDALYKVESGIASSIKEAETVSLVSDGYPCHSRPLARYPYTLLKTKVLKGPIVSFKYPGDHDRKMFNFCQEQDFQALNILVDALVLKNSAISLHLYGLCKGGTNVLRYFAKKGEATPQNIKAAVIESPLLSIETGVQQYPLTHTIIKYLHPNYNAQGETFLDDKKFPNIPILIGHLPHDHMAKSKDVLSIIQHIKDLKKVYDNPTETTCCTSDRKDIDHCRMPKDGEYVSTVQEFFKKYS